MGNTNAPEARPIDVLNLDIWTGLYQRLGDPRVATSVVRTLDHWPEMRSIHHGIYVAARLSLDLNAPPPAVVVPAVPAKTSLWPALHRLLLRR